MNPERPYVLSIAGFDPSAGAGILADAKTFEANKVYGLGVCSAVTFQNANEFQGLNWISAEDIIRQTEVVLKNIRVDWVKIGIIENVDMLEKVVGYLKEKNKNVKIIWDPVLRSSTGFVFHKEIKKEKLEDIVRKIYMITPNWEEMKNLYPGDEAPAGARKLAAFCRVYLKGGHNEKAPGKDFLFAGEKQFAFNPKGKKIYPKHGSGCVLSAALAANLARGYNLHRACIRAKDYVGSFLSSRKDLLGYHK